MPPGLAVHVERVAEPRQLDESSLPALDGRGEVGVIAQPGLEGRTPVGGQQHDVQPAVGRIGTGRDREGREHFWFTVRPLEPAEEGTDRWAVEHGCVSMTPLRLDLTDHQTLRLAAARHPTPETAGE